MILTKKEIYRIAIEQSAVDLSCSPEDFAGTVNRTVLSRPASGARKYLILPHACCMVSYGSCTVASVGNAELVQPVSTYLDSVEASHAFETPNIHELDRILAPHGLRTSLMAEYFLPDGLSEEPPVSYETRWMGPKDFRNLYRPEWSDALCEKRKELDILGIGAFDGEKLIALAACSADGDSMWQIGINILPEYRGRHLSTALTVRLKNEILRRGKVPFYCAAWCNVRSVRNAISSGFRPTWTELHAYPIK